MVFSNNLLAGSGGQSTGYEIDQSIRFNADDSAYLTRYPSVEGNRRTFTLSTWVKFNELRSDNIVFASWIPSGASSYALLYMHSDFRVRFEDQGTSKIKPSMLFVDTAAWYHIVLRVDTTDSVANDRYQMYVNGERQTDLHENDQPSQNHQTNVNKTQPHYLGRNGYSLAMIYSDLYQAETHFLDGVAYDASFFGETDSATGQWIPKKYTGGNYGTNGFYITGEDSTFLGQDVRTSGDQVNSFQASQWTGATGSYTFTDGRIQADTDNKAIKSVDTFTGDFEFSWRYIDMANFVIGFYEIDEDSTFSDSSSAGNMQNMTDSWYVQTSSVAANRDIYYGGTVVVNATTIANGDTWKLQRSSGTIKVYRNGSAVHTFSQTSTNEVRLVVAQGDASADVGEVNWVDNATLGNNLFSSGLSTADQMLDTPTNNFCVLSQVDKFGGGLTLSDGNLRAVPAASAYSNNHGTFYIDSGKWVFECKHTSIFGEACGWSPSGERLSGSSDRGYFMFQDGRAYDNTTNTGTKGASLAAGDFRYVFYDADAQAMWFAHVDVSSSNALVYDNSATKAEIEAGTTTNAVFTSIPAGFWAPGIWMDTSGVIEVNFGQSAFATTSDLPSGFKTLSAANLPDPTVPLPEKYFNAVLYEGNGAGQRVGQFQPLTELYSVSNSVIFNDDDSSYLEKTYSGSESTLTAWSFSIWVKRSKLGAEQFIFLAGTSSANLEYLRFTSSDEIEYKLLLSSSLDANYITDRKFLDSSSWIHIYAYRSSTTFKLYINGVELTNFSTSNAPGSSNGVLGSNIRHRIACDYASVATLFDGYLAEINFVPGTAKAVSDFGQLDASTNKWIPKEYTDSYGTNGFHLDMAVAPGTGNGAGNDVSGNNNDFTENNLVAADQVTDSPTNNFCTLEPLQSAWGGAVTLSNGNLAVAGTAATVWNNAVATFKVPSTGKWIWAAKPSTSGGGQCDPWIVNETGLTSRNNYVYVDTNGWEASFDSSSAHLVLNNNAGTSASHTYGSGDFHVICFDADSKKLWFGVYDVSATTLKFRDGSTGFTGDPAAGTNQTFTLRGSEFTIGFASYTGRSGDVDFGQSDLLSQFTAPSGFNQLNSDNLPLSNGELSAFVWIKNRDADDNHMLFDAVRGVKKDLHSNVNDAEVTNANTLTRFLKNGFEVSNDALVNTNNESYVAWQWLNDSLTTSSNENGSITSTVLAETTSGFSVGTYTGNGTDNATVGHGLGGADMVWVKRRNTTGNWRVYEKSSNKLLYLDLTNAGVSPTEIKSTSSTTFTLGSGNGFNGSGDTHVFYAFQSIDGFSRIDIYEGNGSSDGPFVYTGFKPRWIIFKRYDASDGWSILDTARGSGNFGSAAGATGKDPTAGNEMNNKINANDQFAEEDNSGGSRKCSFLSNGFKIKNTNTAMNASGGDYIYMAFAESPFKTATAR